MNHATRAPQFRISAQYNRLGAAPLICKGASVSSRSTQMAHRKFQAWEQWRRHSCLRSSVHRRCFKASSNSYSSTKSHPRTLECGGLPPLLPAFARSRSQSLDRGSPRSAHTPRQFSAEINKAISNLNFALTSASISPAP
jgi:hypothetical protein